MGMEAIGSGLKTRLQTISDIAIVFAPNEIPDSIPALPCAIILPAHTDYDSTFSGEYDCEFRILILLAKPDLPSALNRILDYANPSGSDSVRAAINGDNTLGSSADDCQVTSNSGAGFTTWGGTQYLSTEFEIVVYG